MNSQPHFLRIVTLSVASVVLIIMAATLNPVCASAPNAKFDAERYVLEQVRKGIPANLAEFPKEQRGLSPDFIAKLLTSRDTASKSPQEIYIFGAVITGSLELVGREIPRNVSLVECTFKGAVTFIGSKFVKSLDLRQSIFESFVDFSDVTVGDHFIAEYCTFGSSSAYFDGMRVGRDIRLEQSRFNSSLTSFVGVRVEGIFSIDESEFNSEEVSFDQMRVVGRFSAQRCHLSHTQSLTPEERIGSRIGFEGAHFADFFLNGTSFNGFSTIDFTRLEADFISFDNVLSTTPTEVKLQRMTFGLVSPVRADELQFLLSPYDPEFYTELETSLRIHGYPDEADRIFIAQKRAERRKNCKSFLQQCRRGAWALSIFEDALAGYGKSLQNLLYWSLGFLIIGTFVFRSEKGMRTKDGKDAENYEGKYHAFWYSLDLFLPVIKLGEADVWTPKDYRRWANLYRKVHIIIGSLFVPIGLAAWTGIIK